MKLLKLGFVLSVLLAANASADVVRTFELHWGGAYGLITINLTTLPNPSGQYDMYDDIVSLRVTIPEGRLGSGTWTKPDLLSTIWYTGGRTLDMTKQLVGQEYCDEFRCVPWGDIDDPHGGDFNVWFTDGGPIGSWFFSFTSDGGDGDSYQLTSFAPSSEIAEPGTMVLMASGSILLGAAVRRKLSL